MTHVKSIFVVLFSLIHLGLSGGSPSSRLPVCSARAPGVTVKASSSCTFNVADAVEARQLQLLGANGHRLPTVQLRAPSGLGGLKGIESVAVQDVILESRDNFPSFSIDLATLLRPPVIGEGSAAVNLTNVAIVHVLSAAKAAMAVATLRGVVSDPIIQRAISTWDLNLYTDYVSFVYVAEYSAPGLTCTGCGIFLRFEDSTAAGNSSSSDVGAQPTLTPDESRPGVNYLLNVDNSTFVPALLRYGSISSPRSFFVLLSSNITWARHPLMRSSGSGVMELNRPMFLVGQQGSTTALDLGMVANAVHLTGAYSNLTFHNVRLENQAMGDKQSATQPSGLSAMNPFNVWMLYWHRLDMRISLVNSTTVASHQEAVQYLIYWQIMMGSSDPALRAEAAWLQRGPGVTLWEAIVYPKRMLDVRFVCRSSLSKNSWRTSGALVFPQLPDNVDDPSLYQTALRVHSAAPLAALAGTNEQLQRWLTTLSGLPREGLAMVVSPELSLGQDDTTAWPPAGDIILKAPKTVLVGQRVCENSSSSIGSGGVLVSGGRVVTRSMPQPLLLEGLGQTAGDAAMRVQCMAGNLSSTGDSGALSPLVRLAHFPMLDWAQDTALVHVQPSESSGVFEINSLTLLGLSQGPGVGANAAEGAVAGVGRRRRLLELPAQLAALPAAGGLLSRHRQQQRQQDKAGCGHSHGRLLAAAAAALPSSPGSSSSGGGGDARPTQADVRVWTHVVWGIKRSGRGQLSLRNVALGLPKPEFQRLLAASMASPGGGFSLPLQGGASLSARSSSYLDNCCLLITSYTAPEMNASQLLLFPDPDTTRSMPPGYFWPYDGSEALAGSHTTAHAALGPAGTAGLVVGLCAAVGLAAAALCALAARRRRRAAAAAERMGYSADVFKQQSSFGDVGRSSHGSAFGSRDYGGKERCCRVVGHEGQQLADVMAVGSAALMGDQQGVDPPAQPSPQHMEASSGASTQANSDPVMGNKRWQKLTNAISSKVQDIHRQRLHTSFMHVHHRTGGWHTGGGGSNDSPRVSGAHSSDSSANNMALQGAAGSADAVGAAASGTFSSSGPQIRQQQQQQDAKADAQDTLELKELIGRGTFGTVYRGSWQGVNVAVKLLQLPPGAGRTMTESGLFGGSAGSNGLLRAVGGWSNAAAGSCGQRGGNDLQKHEYMAVQEAAIGSCMMHPNIVSVYSISLRPSGLPAAMAAAAAAKAAACTSSSSGGLLLLLREDGTTVMSPADLACGGLPKTSAASLELLPWEMQLVMEYCDQGTLREALDAGLLVQKASGLHDVAIVLSLAHNVACAMAYLHQEHIIHGDLKASNVLLKTCVPALCSTSSCVQQQEQQQQQQQRQQQQQQQQNRAPASAAAGSLSGPVTGSWPVDGHGRPYCSSSCNSSTGSVGGCSQPSPKLPLAAGAGTSGPPLLVGQGSAGGGQGQQGLAGGGQEEAGPAASLAIMGAAADAEVSGMHSLLKCGWVVAKVSDFGLSMCVKPEETHVSSVHAGTLTHMAPEMLMHGRCSKASDVYAYGILLWELATGGKAFAGIPKPLLGHCVVSQGMRPTWPAAMRSSSSSNGSGGGGTCSWSGLVALTERCWAQEPQARPSFTEVVVQLARLLKAATASTNSSTIAAGPSPTPPPHPAAVVPVLTPSLGTPRLVGSAHLTQFDGLFAPQPLPQGGLNADGVGAMDVLNPASTAAGADGAWLFRGLFTEPQAHLHSSSSSPWGHVRAVDDVVPMVDDVVATTNGQQQQAEVQQQQHLRQQQHVEMVLGLVPSSMQQQQQQLSLPAQPPEPPHQQPCPPLGQGQQQSVQQQQQPPGPA